MSAQDLVLFEEPKTTSFAVVDDYNDIFCDQNKFAHFYEVAKILASSPIVPLNFKNNPGSCFIALSLSRRMKMDPLMLMQKLYVISNKPAIEAQLGIALVNSCGKYTPMEFVYEGTGEEYGCYATATRKADGKLLVGTKVTLKMAKIEGWSTKQGSKWISMPDQMLGYRCGIFWVRLYDPGLLLGLPTADELEDIEPVKAQGVLPADLGKNMDIYAPAAPTGPQGEQQKPPRFLAVIKSFDSFAVTVDMLEQRAGINKEAWDETHYADFSAVIKEVKSGVGIDNFFKPNQIEPSPYDKAIIKLSELASVNQKLVDKHLAGRNPDNMTVDELYGVIDGVEDEMR